MNETLISFLQQQTCATICCVDEQGKPYCFSCFYAVNFKEGLLYFKSSSTSHHSDLLNKSPFIAGTILPDKLNTLIVKGLQLEGFILDENHPKAVQASENYHKKHPLAWVIPGKIWTIQISFIKMTDSTKGFGKKITWNLNDEVTA